jgi:hypothetical protein
MSKISKDNNIMILAPLLLPLLDILHLALLQDLLDNYLPLLFLYHQHPFQDTKHHLLTLIHQTLAPVTLGILFILILNLHIIFHLGAEFTLSLSFPTLLVQSTSSVPIAMPCISS